MTIENFEKSQVKTIFKRQFSETGADSLGGLGSGAGKGGGAGGTIREAGGGLGKYGAAKEEEYFYKKRTQQLKELNTEMEMKKKGRYEKEKFTKVEDIIQKNRKRIAKLNKCFRNKK